MNRIKTLLIVSLVLALSLTMIGCNLLPSGSSTDVETGSLETVPEWLTLAHRAEAAEPPEIDVEENGDEGEVAETPTATVPAATQPATTQPATTQPAPQPAPQPSGTPRYLQPGTMEHIAKLQLDQYAFDYNRTTDPERRKDLLGKMIPIANGIGLDLKATYGITLPVATEGLGHSFDSMESPTGGIFGN